MGRGESFGKKKAATSAARLVRKSLPRGAWLLPLPKMLYFHSNWYFRVHYFHAGGFFMYAYHRSAPCHISLPVLRVFVLRVFTNLCHFHITLYSCQTVKIVSAFYGRCSVFAPLAWLCAV